MFSAQTRPERDIEGDGEIVPHGSEAIARSRGNANAALGRANEVGDLLAALQDDDDDEEMHDQHDQAQHCEIAGAMQAEQQRHVRERNA
jgi:hypothetical protein